MSGVVVAIEQLCGEIVDVNADVVAGAVDSAYGDRRNPLLLPETVRDQVYFAMHDVDAGVPQRC